MPTHTGRINKIYLNPKYSMISLDTGGIFFLWSYLIQDDDAKSRIAHGQYLTLARDCMANNWECTVVNFTNSSIVQAMEVVL